jgi:hypothetical protein
VLKRDAAVFRHDPTTILPLHPEGAKAKAIFFARRRCIESASRGFYATGECRSLDGDNFYGALC